MASCKQQDFYGYFKENMEELGLDAPTTVFGTQATAATHIGAMLTAFKTLGKNATIAELIGATTGLEKLIALGAFRAAWYIGAAVGSFAVATGRYSACGTSIADVMFDLHQNGLYAPEWLRLHFARQPEILETRHPARPIYANRARQ